MTVVVEDEPVQLSRAGAEFGRGEVAVEFLSEDRGTALRLSSPRGDIGWIICRWDTCAVDEPLILNDHWERGYGDLSWRGYVPRRMLPWYFLLHDGSRTCGVGVVVQPNAFCFWDLTPRELVLVCDVRNGRRPVRLGNRRLDVCTIVSRSYEGLSPFAATCEFCKQLCERPLTPDRPIYGFNDWLCAYGRNSATSVRRDAATLASLTEGLAARPYCVIDAGWLMTDGVASGGPVTRANHKFGDMKVVADSIKDAGVHPGIWMRPLATVEKLPEGAKIDHRRLDPSHPVALRYVAESIRHLVCDWGFELIKHDFSTFDVFGKWGFRMLDCMTGPNTMTFQDKSKTTAEIILELYRVIRDSAGGAVILGCNTFSHLAAGLVEIQRTGDDTSGREWERTLRMGVNTLAFRMPQHRSFYAADADCVGLTREVPWRLNRRWLDLLAKSGTPLFVSAAPDALGRDQRSALKDAFATASLNRPTAEPLDWLINTLPRVWRIDGKTTSYDWFTDAPVVLGQPAADDPLD